MGGGKSYKDSEAHDIVGGLFPPVDAVSFPLNDKVWLPPSYFMFFILRDQKRKEVNILAWEMDPENQEVIELLLQTGNRKDWVWYPSDPLGVS